MQDVQLSDIQNRRALHLHACLHRPEANKGHLASEEAAVRQHRGHYASRLVGSAVVLALDRKPKALAIDTRLVKIEFAVDSHFLRTKTCLAIYKEIFFQHNLVGNEAPVVVAHIAPVGDILCHIGGEVGCAAISRRIYQRTYAPHA